MISPLFGQHAGVFPVPDWLVHLTAVVILACMGAGAIGTWLTAHPSHRSQLG